MLSGIGPLKKFLSRINFFKDESCPMEMGILPFSEFDFKHSNSNDARRPNVDGIDPARELLPIRTVTIFFDQLPIVLGIVP